MDVLSTKLHVPPIHGNLIPRPRLTRRLSEGMALPLVLISAPAGFGKTTLLSEWYASVVSPKLRLAWIALDEGDNDPARFLSCFVAALRTVQPDVEEAVPNPLQSLSGLTMISTMRDLIAQITGTPTDMAVILDDYHVIDAQPIHQAIQYLLEHVPPHLHLVIATRADPPLPLARLRAQRQLLELRADDLRFTLDEATVFLNDVMSLALSRDDLAVLEERTEGWIVGLNLAALSLQGRKDTSDLIRMFTGSHRFVLDYLVDEVLARQPPAVQSFLMQTAILDRLTGSLCDALTGQSNGDTILETLDRANLFVVPLDDQRRWYRYHHLFTDMLRHRMRQQQTGQLPQLHCAAAEWYEQNGWITEAVRHRLAARDFAAAAQLIERVAPELLWQRGEVETLFGWLGALPDEFIRPRVRLGLTHAWVLLLASRWDAVERRLEDIQSTLQTGSPTDTPDPQETKRQSSAVEAVRAMLASFRGDIPGSIEICQRALPHLPEEERLLRGVLAGNLGGAYVISGNMIAARQALTDAVQLCQAAGNRFGSLVALCYLGYVEAVQSRLHASEQTYRQVLDLATKQRMLKLGFQGMANAGLGWLHYEWNDLETAEQYLMAAMEDLADPEGGVVFAGTKLPALLGSYLGLARIHQARGNWADAVNLLRQADILLLSEGVPPEEIARIAATRARLWLESGNLDSALAWAHERGITPDAVSIWPLEPSLVTLARILLTQGRQQPDGSYLGDAMRLLERLRQEAEAGGRLRAATEVDLLWALALQAAGKVEESLSTLEHVLARAQPEGYVRLFVDEGLPMAQLLSQALARGVASRYVRKLLSGFDQNVLIRVDGLYSLAPSLRPLPERLTDRELEVLRLVADGLSNQEIADRLTVTLATVKKHVGNILGKLEASSRTQAVAKARELRLI